MNRIIKCSSVLDWNRFTNTKVYHFELNSNSILFNILLGFMDSWKRTIYKCFVFWFFINLETSINEFWFLILNIFFDDFVFENFECSLDLHSFSFSLSRHSFVQNSNVYRFWILILECRWKMKKKNPSLTIWNENYYRDDYRAKHLNQQQHSHHWELWMYSIAKHYEYFVFCIHCRLRNECRPKRRHGWNLYGFKTCPTVNQKEGEKNEWRDK